MEDKPLLTQIFKKFFLFFLSLGVASAITLIAIVAWEVYYGDRQELEKSTILAKIKEETTIFYLDEETKIGSIFESRHRNYRQIGTIPAHMINAIVAVEDKNFYKHFGINPFTIIKAFFEGLANKGRFRGGSTLTQQTVKNIIHDWRPTLARKFKEMIKAIQLEQIYTKEQILEFYLNQFHVAGNGHGIGIAAKYYFDKDVLDLTLNEAAFIAGSVKGPSKYNPFIKYSKKAQEQAKKEAFIRKNYVLQQMLQQKWISQEDHDAAKQEPVPFKRGEFRTAEVALVNLIKKQIGKKEILDSLNLSSTKDLALAGFKVYTTIDKSTQEAAQLATRNNLSRLETILSGFKSEDPKKYKVQRNIKAGQFLYGKITAIYGNNAKNYSLQVSLGIPSGNVPNASLQRYAKLLNLAVPKGNTYYVEQLYKQLRVGDVIYVYVKSYDKANNIAELELKKRPIISGGMIVLAEGEVRAVVSGFDTLGFNRAIDATRQPGSLFKVVTLLSGLQLGWSLLDQAPNYRQVFSHQGTFYYPRPDHPSPYATTSLLWTGLMSENLAAVSLGAQLLDKLNFQEFQKLLRFLDLYPYEEEEPRDFHYRLSRSTGVSLDVAGIKAQLLKMTINDLGPDLIFAGRQPLLRQLKSIWWGQGYLPESLLIRQEDSDLSLKEKETRLKILSNNYLRLEKLYQQLQSDWDLISSYMHRGIDLEQSYQDPIFQKAIQNFKIINQTGKKPAIAYNPILEKEEAYAEIEGQLLIEPQGRPLNIIDIQTLWGSQYGLKIGEVKLGAYLEADLFAQIQEEIKRRYKDLLQDKDPYQIKHYFHHHDLRISIGLNYMVQLSRQCGIYNQLKPVLSFPLGSNDITLSEAAKLYQTFISGKTYRFSNNSHFHADDPLNQINFIRKITDRHGKVLYQPIIHEHQLIDPAIVMQMHEILGKVITHGTGRRARDELYIILDQLDEKGRPRRIRIPSFGKTGTTNNYLTSSFAGFLPYPTKYGKALDTKSSLTISAYVGYDWNRMMQRGRAHIYGSVGALPMWIDLANAVVRDDVYKNKLDNLDLSVIAHKKWPIKKQLDSSPLMIDLPSGLVLRAGNHQDVEVWNSTTDIATSGEEYRDYFVHGSVKSVVYMPPGTKSWQAPRLFAPYKKTPVFTEEESGEDKLDSEIVKTESSITDVDA